jgi:hypothetical protein
VSKGWNYIGILMDEIYEYSYLTIYHRSEQDTGAKKYNKYETFFAGYYYYQYGNTPVLASD